VLDVEVFGAAPAPNAPSQVEVERLCGLAATAVADIQEGHLAIEYVDAATIARLNDEHRGKPEPTDVLSFPIDGADLMPGTVRQEHGASGDVGDRRRSAAPRELGDVMICPAHTADVREAIVHGVLHLLGMDHETDDGEMLALQARLLGETEDP
jgi:probable rRNA maturation factor